jgi:peptidoglycan/LPS O-acetylase OafA/YrhL
VGLANSSTPNRLYRPDIDGLRAVAILSVVFHHAGLRWLPGGFTGVDIFFVISGYLIGGHIYSEVRAGAFSYLRFYQRRARRILPAFYAVLLFTMLAALLLLSPLEASLFGRSALAATLSVSNFLFWHSARYFDTKSEFVPLLMTWSLAVEEQFYAIVPLLMVLLARLRRSLILPAILAVCALSLLLAQYQLSGQSQAALQAAFYLLPARAWELGIGVALAVTELSRKHRMWPQNLPRLLTQGLSLFGLAMMLAPILLLTADTPFPGAAALPTVLGTALLIAVPASSINRRLLSLPPLVFVGKVSYSWYLWHWPLLAFLHILCGSRLPSAAPYLAIVSAFVAAVLSYFFVEQPFRKSALPPAPLLLRYAVVSTAMLVACAVIWLSDGLPQRYPTLARMELANPPLDADPCMIEGAAYEPNTSPACYNASNPKPAVVLWGDSHAAALAPGLRALAIAQGYRFVQLTKAACLPLAGVMRHIPRIPAQASLCLDFNRKVLNLIQADRNIRIVVLTGGWTAGFQRNWEDGWLLADTSRQPRNSSPIPSVAANQALFVQSLSAQVQILRAAGKYVIVLEDVPNFDADPLSRVRTAHIPARHALAKWLLVADTTDSASDPGFAPNSVDAAVDPLALDALQKAVPAVDDAELVDLKPSFCLDSSHCNYRDGDRLLYFDSGHLTAYGARFALRNFRLPALTAFSQQSPQLSAVTRMQSVQLTIVAAPLPHTPRHTAWPVQPTHNPAPSRSASASSSPADP